MPTTGSRLIPLTVLDGHGPARGRAIRELGHAPITSRPW